MVLRTSSMFVLREVGIFGGVNHEKHSRCISRWTVGAQGLPYPFMLATALLLRASHSQTPAFVNQVRSFHFKTHLSYLSTQILLVRE